MMKNACECEKVMCTDRRQTDTNYTKKLTWPLMNNLRANKNLNW